MLCFLFSCTTDISDSFEEQNEELELTLRGSDKDKDHSCCDFEYSTSTVKVGECCITTVTLHLDYNRCPELRVTGPNGNVPSTARARYIFEVNSCDYENSKFVTFTVIYPDFDSQTSVICQKIKINPHC